MKSISIFCLLIFLFVGCNEKKKEIIEDKRYDVLKDYVTKIKPTAYFDTAETNQNYYFLKSLLANDPEKMKVFCQNIFRSEIEANSFYKLDTSIHKADIFHSSYDELYRFYYAESFCWKRVDFTILKRNDSFQLQLIIYSDNNSDPNIKPQIKIHYHQKIKIKQDEWEKFKELISKADFWYLEEYNRDGFDGDNLCVLGFDKSRSAYDKSFKIVNRHSSHTALWDVYQYLVFISKTKIDMGCGN